MLLMHSCTACSQQLAAWLAGAHLLPGRTGLPSLPRPSLCVQAPASAGPSGVRPCDRPDAPAVGMLEQWKVGAGRPGAGRGHPGREGGEQALRGTRGTAVPLCQASEPHLPSARPAVQCVCCDRRSLVLQDVCMEHSADLLAVLRASGAGGGEPGELECLHLVRCHLAELALVPAGGGEGEAQRLALEGVNHLQLQNCSGQMEGIGAEAALRELLPQLPSLTGLAVEECELEAGDLPTCCTRRP